MRFGRIPLAIASLLATVGLLHGSAQTAAACICQPSWTTEEVLELAPHLDLIIEGTIVPNNGDPSAPVEVDVERWYHGASPGRIALDQPWGASDHAGANHASDLGPDCSYRISGPAGSKYLLTLTETDTGYRPNGCMSFAFAELDAEYAYVFSGPLYKAIQQAFAEAAALPDTGAVAQETAAESEDLPWYIFLAGSFIVPLAVLFVGSFWMRRGPGGH